MHESCFEPSLQQTSCGGFTQARRETVELTAVQISYEWSNAAEGATEGATRRNVYLGAKHVSQSPVMASNPSNERQPDLTESSMTVPSDSENYSSSNNELSPSPPSSSSSPLILYSPPTFWGLLRGAAINLLLPFVNGLMLGFGELLAHEAAFRLGWSGTKVCCQTNFKWCNYN
ncbi:MAG: hypothetical protein Q9171_006511 [Xanthocarpia ochracea]